MTSLPLAVFGRAICLTTLLAVGVWLRAQNAPEPFLRDTSFRIGSGPDASVDTTVVQPDRRILIGGRFQRIDGQLRPWLARLNADGTVDETFSAGGTISNRVNRIALLPDGRLLVATLAENGQAALSRLHPEGALDTEFTADPNLQMARINPCVASDGSYLVYGRWPGRIGASQLVKLTPDGALDTNYPAHLFLGPARTQGVVEGLVPLPDGGALVFGPFTNGPAGSSQLLKLDAAGVPDPSFQPTLSTSDLVQQVLRQADGRLLVRTTRAVFRLLPDGSPDATLRIRLARDFAGGATSIGVSSLALQPDGGIVLAGGFDLVNETIRRGLARVDAAGVVDPAFDPGIGLVFSSGGAIEIQPGLGLLLSSASAHSLEAQASAYLTRLKLASAASPATLHFASSNSRFRQDMPAATVSVVRADGALGPCEVDCATVPGTAKDGADYLGGDFHLVFAAGERSQTVRIPLVQGRTLDGPEYFYVRLVRVRGSGILAAERLHRVELVENRVRGTAGGVDRSFVAHLDSPVTAMARYPDGRFLVATAGQYAVEGSIPARLVRLLANGQNDPTFVCTTRLDGNGRLSLVPQADGGCVLGGRFVIGDGTSTEEEPRVLIRLKPDGSLDPVFDPVAATWPEGSANPVQVSSILEVLPMPDQGWWCAGFFYDPNASPSSLALLRLRPDGLFDPDFRPAYPPAGYVERLLLRSDQAVLVWGTELFPRRLLANGLVDPRFVAERRFTSSPACGPDARTYGISSFTLTQNALALNPDGSLVAGYSQEAFTSTSAEFPSFIQVLSVDDYGRATVVGQFDQVGGVPRRGLARLWPDGSLDFSFDPGSGLDGLAQCILPLPDGGWLLGGTLAGADGFPQPYLVKLLPERPDRPLTFNLAAAAAATPENAGRCVVRVYRTGDASQAATVRLGLSADGTVAGEDLGLLPAVLQFAAGEWAKTLEVPLVNDEIAEANESFTLTLSSPSWGYALGTASLTQTIVNDDANLEFVQTELAVDEIDGSVAVPVRCFGNWAAPVSVILEAGPFQLPVHFPVASGSTSTLTNRVRVPIQDDDRAQGDWTLALRLTHPAGAALTAHAVATVHVTDNDFASSPGRGVAGEVQVLAAGPLDTLYVAGDFTAVHGVRRWRVARLLDDGSVDPAFDAGTGPDGAVTAAAVDGEGRLLIAGAFETVAGSARRGLARLLPEGALDPSFDPGAGATYGTNAVQFTRLVVQPDGRILVGGVFTNFGGFKRSSLVRLEPSGAVDESFVPPFKETTATVFPRPGALETVASEVTSLALLPDGRILVGGTLHSAKITSPSPASGYDLARLLPNGEVDHVFGVLPRVRSGVTAAVPLPGGDTLAGYTLDNRELPGSVTASWLALTRRTEDGSVSTNFFVRGLPKRTFESSVVEQIWPLTNGQFLVLARFDQARGVPASGSSQSVVLRLQADGTFDPAFALRMAVDPPAVAYGLLPRSPLIALTEANAPAIKTLANSASGVVTLAGALREIDGTPRRGLARLDPNGALRGELELVAWRESELGNLELRLPAEVAAPYRLEQSVDLVHWAAVATNANPWAAWRWPISAEDASAHRFYRAVQVDR